MNREDLRLVEFTVIEKSKPKKGKKTQKKEKKKIGLFHLWGTNVNGKGNEKFYGLIEEDKTGLLLEVSYKDIRFLSDDEVEEIFDAAEADEEILLTETEEALTEEAPAGDIFTDEAPTAVSEETPAVAAPKPRPSRAKKA